MSAATDPIQLLLDDHRTVRKLLSDYDSLCQASTPENENAIFSQRFELTKRLVKDLQVHEQLEETIFYPFFKQESTEKEDKELIDKSLKEHHAVDLIVKDLLTAAEPNKEEFEEKMKLMSQNLHSHMDEEEKEVFPKARELLGDRSQTLLDSMVALKKKLEEELESATDEKLEEKAVEKADTETVIPDTSDASVAAKTQTASTDTTEAGVQTKEGEKVAGDGGDLTKRKHGATESLKDTSQSKKAKQR